MGSNEYCILWNNYHETLVSNLEEIRLQGQFVDVTIVCPNGGHVYAHQVVLASCSSFFREFIKENPSKHPIVLLPAEFCISEVQSVIQFIYSGKVCVPQDQLKAFIKAARYLRIKGLEDSEEDSEVEAKTLQSQYTSKDLSENVDGPFVPIHSTSGKNLIRDRKCTIEEESEALLNKDTIVERQPIMNSGKSGKRKKRKFSVRTKRPMHLSTKIVCYEAVDKDRDQEPINKIRRLTSPGGLSEEDVDICTCTSRKIWSVKDTEGLLAAWKETLQEVPPSYFIRSMALCRSVAARLQDKGIRKNWRQCQVKMKNLRREVRLYKECHMKTSSRKASEVANACEKLLPYIEDIFNKEEEIRQDWYRMKEEKDDKIGLVDSKEDILAHVSVLADSDTCDDDTDANGITTEYAGEQVLQDNDSHDYVTHLHTPHYTMHTGPDGTVHHIVEDISLRLTDDKSENLFHQSSHSKD